MKYRHRFSVFFTVLALFMGAILASCGGGVSSGEIGASAPDFTLNTLSGGSFTMSGTKGKVVILDFWAGWCPPCKKELPHFQALHRAYEKKGLKVIGVLVDARDMAEVESLLQEYEISYPILLGNASVAAAYGGVRSIPTTFMIDREGRIVRKFVGYRDKEVFETVVKELL
ncbi:MAG: redoxin domain-containing protein [Candidatus Omnitrophota bacterium]